MIILIATFVLIIAALSVWFCVLHYKFHLKYIPEWLYEIDYTRRRIWGDTPSKFERINVRAYYKVVAFFTRWIG